MTKPNVVVVIPTLDRGSERVKECLESLKDTSQGYVNMRVLVWENDRLGFPRAVNDAVKSLKWDFDGIVLLNDDTAVLHPSWLNEITELGTIKDCIVGAKGTFNISLFGVPYVAFWAVYIPKRVWEKVGYLDEDFGLGNGDDIDYCYRAEREGFKIKEAKDCHILHRGSMTFKSLKGVDFEKLKQDNNAYLCKKWGW